MQQRQAPVVGLQPARQRHPTPEDDPAHQDMEAGKKHLMEEDIEYDYDCYRTSKRLKSEFPVLRNEIESYSPIFVPIPPEENQAWTTRPYYHPHNPLKPLKSPLFRLMDLPYELRSNILEFALLEPHFSTELIRDDIPHHRGIPEHFTGEVINLVSSDENSETSSNDDHRLVYDYDSEDEERTKEYDADQVVLSPSPLNVCSEGEDDMRAFLSLPILRVNRQLRHEALHAAFTTNTFNISYVMWFHRFLSFIGPDCWQWIRHLSIDDPFFPGTYEQTPTEFKETMSEDQVNTAWPSGFPSLTTEIFSVISSLPQLKSLRLVSLPYKSFMFWFFIVPYFSQKTGRSGSESIRSLTVVSISY
ncbi:hypothetical protein BT63DRAFT_229499 [Microthyrium microscopicum]|uniref:Uncharacterized protein n=1 Tax=Microthyrium microscopicum TaxID=703497 RepID=A0A6A6UD67_9PEZI|nr:hypothetical protein BT63DRAFT_229499 [Microthyrium microscopicum]